MQWLNVVWILFYLQEFSASLSSGSLKQTLGFFRFSSLYDTNILSESNAATSNKTATRSTDALLASKEEKLISFSLPVFSNGEGSNEQNPTLSGSLSVVEGLLLTSMHFPPNWCSQSFFHCWASANNSPRTPEGATPL